MNQQLNLFTGKHPAQNIIDRLTEKIKLNGQKEAKKVPSIRFIKYL